MNTQTLSKASHRHSVFESGTTLLEVLLAIVIFAVGMLALASLQTNVTRSSSDANMRTNAANIAEETIERMRGEAGKGNYDGIVGTNFTESRGGVDYVVDVDVKDYYFMPDRVTVTDDPGDLPGGVVNSSFKFANLTVTWNTGIEFQIDADTSTTDRLGSGNIAISGIIPSISSLNNAKVAAEGAGALGYPPVNYTPGLNPDIVAIQLADQKFKESTTPEPVVRRADELVETWFDVITYTSDGSEATFLRREEFASISCECTLHGASGSGADGREPTTWNGAEYDEGATVGKQYGESASNQQSQYCDVCCQDHHDTGSGPDSYRPLAASFSGDHKHYSRNNKGVLTEATPGKDYIEACRLIRKDGFFRVAQDFNQQSQTVFPENYLDDGSEVTAYSDYVTDAVEDHFAGLTWPPHGLTFEGRDVANPSALPTSTGAVSQQLRSRGIYTDEISPALQNNLNHCFDNYLAPTPVATPDDPDCFVKNISSPLEIYPFFDVQLTKLSRWKDKSQGDPVVVTNEALETDNTHSRGVASLAKSKVGLATVESGIETSNVGLISIASVKTEPPDGYSYSDVFIAANGGVAPPPPVNPVVQGTITTGTGVPAGISPSAIGGGGATCTMQADNITFSCVIDYTATAPTLTVGNYYTKVKGKEVLLLACSTGLVTSAVSQGGSNSSTYTRFNLPTTNTSGITITIVKGTSCS